MPLPVLSKSRSRWLAVGAAGAAGAAAMYFGDKAPYPYRQHRLLDLPLPFLTSNCLDEILQPRPGERMLEIGPGTGLAPFRGFLQERAALKGKEKTLGPAMLFFGCRHPDQDYLYADELKAFAVSGIADLHTAFSRGEGPKTYVQNLVTAEKERVWNLIEQGAIIYVCGDGGKMEPDVKAALVAIYRERSGADADAGQRWIDDLGAKNRYVLDVWAGG